MPLWKQRMFSRLMGPADDEGGDLGGGISATEAAMDAIGVQDAPTENDPPADVSADSQSDADPEAGKTDDEPAKPGSRMAAMLDELTDDPNAAPKTEAKPAEPVADADKAAKPDEPKTPEAEEAELLEGVKSERGRERIKQVFAERKQLEQDIGEFRGLVKSTGMSPQEFAQTLEFGRLMSSGDEKNLRVALEMIEGQRSALYQKLGVEAPGVDLLTGHDDLKAAVDSMEITRDKAVELAKYRKQQQEVTQRQQVEQRSVQERQQYEQTVQQAAGSMEQYLETRKNEIDHPARMKVITEHFKNPANLQQFVGTYRPEQWAATVKMMYDNIQVPRSQAAGPQPIRSRPTSLGMPAASAASPIDRVAQRMESMGL